LAQVRKPPVPRATYRLQFTKAFSFKEAALTVSLPRESRRQPVYASVYLNARSASTQGYDSSITSSSIQSWGSTHSLRARMSPREDLSHIDVNDRRMTVIAAKTAHLDWPTNQFLGDQPRLSLTERNWGFSNAPVNPAFRPLLSNADSLPRMWNAAPSLSVAQGGGSCHGRSY
jgi:hypothetical protein